MTIVLEIVMIWVIASIAMAIGWILGRSVPRDPGEQP